MFDQNQNNQTRPSGPPAGSVAGPNGPAGLKPSPFGEEVKRSDLPAVEMPKSGQPPVVPKPGGVEPGTVDIFAETEEGPAVLATELPKTPKVATPPKPPTPPPSGPPEPLTELPDDIEEGKGGGKKFLAIGLAVLVIALLGAGGYYAYGKFFAAKGLKIPELNLNQVSPDILNKEFEDDIINLNLNKNTNQGAEELNENVNQAPTIKEITLDSDKDGLTDDEEELYGTDPTEPDSDGDGLFDKEEVKVYKTNPLDPDTDMDGYLDGEEVKAGYNPNGPGKLLEVNFE